MYIESSYLDGGYADWNVTDSNFMVFLEHGATINSNGKLVNSANANGIKIQSVSGGRNGLTICIYPPVEHMEALSFELSGDVGSGTIEIGESGAAIFGGVYFESPSMLKIGGNSNIVIMNDPYAENRYSLCIRNGAWFDFDSSTYFYMFNDSSMIVLEKGAVDKCSNSSPLKHSFIAWLDEYEEDREINWGNEDDWTETVTVNLNIDGAKWKSLEAIRGKAVGWNGELPVPPNEFFRDFKGWMYEGRHVDSTFPIPEDFEGDEIVFEADMEINLPHSLVPILIVLGILFILFMAALKRRG